MIISTTAPEDADPVYPHATIYLACLNDRSGVQIHVSTQQTIRINDAKGNEVWQQTVIPNQPQDVTLPSGIYMLYGEKEQVEIHL